MTDERPRAHAVLVLGVDPGTTTGLALIALDVLDSGRPHAVWSDQLPWQEAAAAVEARLARMRRALDMGEADRAVAVAEKFTVNPQTASRGQQGIEDAIGMRGVVRRNCALAKIEYVGSQDASSAKSLVKDDTLRHLKLYTPGLKHSCDAYRHAVLWAVRNKVTAAKLLLEGA